MFLLVDIRAVASVWRDAACFCVVDCGLCCHRQCSVDSRLPKCAVDSQSQVHRLTLMPGEFFVLRRHLSDKFIGSKPTH